MLTKKSPHPVMRSTGFAAAIRTDNMGSESANYIRLVFCLLSFSATVCAQAIVPNPSDIAPVINQPNAQNSTIISLADYMIGNVTVHDALKQALLACQQNQASKLVIPTGRYVIDDPKV